MSYLHFSRCRALVISLIMISFFQHSAFAQRSTRGYMAARAKALWVDSVYDRLTMEERIGQLFMVAAYSGTASYNEPAITQMIENHQIGGLIFMQGGPIRQANLTNQFQRKAQVPLLLAMDAEWGLGMRLDSVANFPRQMMLGATADTTLVYQMGKAIAAQCNRLKVNVDFAPVIDVNNNPLNPVINMRSFGEDKTRVARMGIAYMHGLQSNGVIACAKHFPGHGDTETDSHKDLPTINKSLAQLDTLELYPFKKLIKAGIKSIMVAHLEIPALEQEPHVPTTLSKNTVTNLLKDTMGFDGIVFTDALNMQGAAKYFEPGEVELRAFLAGNDMLLMGQNAPLSIGKIKQAILDGKTTEQDLAKRVKKILGAKYDAGLNKPWKDIDTRNITEDINKEIAPLRKKIAAASVTLVRDKNKIIQKIAANKYSVGYIGINESTNVFSGELLQSCIHRADWLPKNASDETADRLVDSMSLNNINIVVVHGLNIYPARNYGLDDVHIRFLEKIKDRSDVMIVIMGNAYFMNKVCEARSAIVAYDDDTLTQKAVVNVLTMKKLPVGRLPVSVCRPVDSTKGSTGRVAPPSYKLEQPDNISQAGVVNKTPLNRLDSFIGSCISQHAFPGCRVLAAKNGKYIYDKSFGYLDYSNISAVNNKTIYDVASLTKVLATTLAVMHLYDEKKIAPDKTIADYLPQLKGKPNGSIKIRNLLLHQAGLKSWIPFYKETILPDGNLNTALYQAKAEKGFSTPVAKDLYLRNDYKDTIWNRINNYPRENEGRYVYSDLDFYYLAAIVEQITNTRLDDYVEKQFYQPLGLKSIFYNPLQKTESSRIAPTENDLVFRHQQVAGYVHDQGAALLGGVAGHAGIFATAHDVAVIFQMLLNEGSYNGRQYFQPATIREFTAYNSSISRRGLGFDKPDADDHNAIVTGDRCSGYTFGHQGFTGTCAWADPETGVVFVFLSNRVYPNAENGLIGKLNVRTLAQDYIYEALGIPENNQRAALKAAQLKQQL